MFLRYTELTQDALPSGAGAVAVLSLAAIETHGPHLPLGTDAAIVEGILDCAERLDRERAGAVRADVTVIRLPPLWLGASAEHAGRAGTLSREPEALVAAIVDVGAGLARTGVRRLLLFNGHGGNVAAAQIAALKLRTRLEFLTGSLHWLDLGLPEDLVPPAPVGDDVHGGWIETSAMLHLAPALVKMELARAAPSASPAPSLFPKGPVAWGWTSDDLAPGGWIGRPELAREEIGRRLVEHAAAGLRAVLHDLAQAAWPS